MTVSSSSSRPHHHIFHLGGGDDGRHVSPPGDGEDAVVVVVPRRGRRTTTSFCLGIVALFALALAGTGYAGFYLVRDDDYDDYDHRHGVGRHRINNHEATTTLDDFGVRRPPHHESGGGGRMRDKKKTKGNKGDGKFPGGGVGGGSGGMMGGSYDKGGDERRDGTTDVVVGRNGWGIREAIHNIDRVFMDKRNRLFPPDPRRAPLPPPLSREYELTAEDDATVSESSSLLPMVIDDTLPENADAIDDYAYSPIPASDALECRSSVISFVINATDVKDECDGLRRAFDKACSVQETTTNPITTWGGSPESETEKAENSPSLGEEGGGYYNNEDRDPDRRGSRRRRRRMLGRDQYWTLTTMRRLFARMIAPAMEGLDGAEDGKDGTKAMGRMSWSENDVDRGGDGSDGDVGVKRLRSNDNNRYGTTIIREAGRIYGASSVETIDLTGFEMGGWWERTPFSRFYSGMARRVLKSGAVGEIDVESSTLKQERVEVPLISLNIPTANKHVSEDMLNEALLLQQTDVMRASASETHSSLDSTQSVGGVSVQSADVDVDVPPEPTDTDLTTASAAANRPNITADAAAAAAVKDVAESAEAIRTAVVGVQKSMMNDPKSVEARTCCASILSVFHEHCDPTTTGVEDYSDQRLLVIVFVITVCGMVKSLIRHLNVRWLPEAGGCILVGVLGCLVLQHMPHVRFAFDGDMFLRIMVPPIVFEAAVKINKQSFRRHVIPITIFAIVGTLASTALTALILHKGSTLLGHYATTIPVKESLIFGALISSIDPIAVLSVLSSMGMTDTDTIYVLIFGESLLNDGVAIVLFQTLVHFLDESLVIDSEVILDASMHFVVVAMGSVSVGMASGACATLYFSLMHGCQTPMVEVIMFYCWSFIPYYICDMVEWSGIVAIVANGFVMDLYVIGQKHQQLKTSNSDVEDEIDFLVNGTGTASISNVKTRPYRQQQCRSIFTYDGHLSPKADSHVHFVIEIFATLMETAIFAYLGLFLFSPRYHWSFYLSLMSIIATVLGRVIMIPLFSHVANIFNRMSLSGQQQQSPMNINEGVHIDRRMQVVLVFAGLRGAMSFALVEHIPMYDTTTGQGSRLKPELKAMTSASIIFTLFVLGGATSYLLERLGYCVNKQQGQDDVEIASLMGQNQDKRRSPVAVRRNIPQANHDTGLRNNGSVRQRGPR
ncbi:hypothetical protein ACHAXA_010832 [Cyclostephanos tholiformis]|uniref:Cation/H+ exchanger transmembrane domain-containing protein n=1 Tax=Cyclostephanos tholiformis TaxID=382380 RepID=A0ABD3SGM5_9STRA